ncbi:PhzF family phenazine biosynthesis protein [Reichenbachiella agarivorans]|uniref:PhzF family phenazine biosynthesis protein n=1 Tax=Reichenbachiella agarivorans TaxID=2979464 RepID=A0ABY6CLS7_9BACT|nr:PhzF family phenazine biosynthesis protein [Reichenbachiella agarivorans]UXP30674.1 PhzF family phenazine biosynthesis protein [Reichenbachiella agarivorans]
MGIKTYTVDAFTDQPFTGNPAAICLLEEPLTEELMQQIAVEYNLSETGFIIRKSENHFGVRYFSPRQEIPLCGHATLSAAKILFMLDVQMNQVIFDTIGGLRLYCERRGDQIMMKFPLYDSVAIDLPEPMMQALGIDKAIASRLAKDTKMLLLEIESEAVLRTIKPDFKALVNSYTGIDGVIVTAKSESDYDFVSRYFWPWAGSDEDPVTGAAHTVLAKYWSDKLGKSQLHAYQVSQRGGFMFLELDEKGHLEITSSAVIMMTGDLRI